MSRNRYQARLYIGPGKADSVNLGLYETEEAANAARKAVTARLPAGRQTPLTVWEATKAAMRIGLVSPTVLPKYVYRANNGYYAESKRIGTLGPFKTPEEACGAMLRKVERGSLHRS